MFGFARILYKVAFPLKLETWLLDDYVSPIQDTSFFSTRSELGNAKPESRSVNKLKLLCTYGAPRNKSGVPTCKDSIQGGFPIQAWNMTTGWLRESYTRYFLFSPRSELGNAEPESRNVNKLKLLCTYGAPRSKSSVRTCKDSIQGVFPIQTSFKLET